MTDLELLESVKRNGYTVESMEQKAREYLQAAKQCDTPEGKALALRTAARCAHMANLLRMNP